MQRISPSQHHYRHCHSYNHDYVPKKAAGGLKNDFTADDIILNDDRVAVKMFDGMGVDSL